MNAILAPQHLDAIAAAGWTWLVEFLPGVVTALIILAVGAFASRWASKLTFKLAERTGRVDLTIEPALASGVRYAILILFVIAALGQLGVQTGSLLAVLGAAGLAIGLALQGTLSNIAAGIMLLWLRPFKLGDYIEVVAGNPFAGTVREIGLFACLIETYDGVAIFAPNATIWNFALRNHSRNAGRLVSLAIEFSDKANSEQARAILLEMLADDERILKSPAPNVFVDRLEGGGLSLTCRLWAKPSDIGAVQRSVIAEAKRRLEAPALEALVPRRIARIVPPDADPSRLID
jgi:small conductance mechanosensitive channel